MNTRPGIVSLAWVALALNGPIAAATSGRTTTTLYVGPHFEVRDHDQPVKYVFHGDTRVARITGSLSANSRVQRLRLHTGWNLCSLAVGGARLPSSPEISSAHRWTSPSGGYVPVDSSETLAAGTILWIKARTNAVIAVVGTFVEPTAASAPSGGGYVASPGLERWPLNLPPGVTIWKFDTATGHWLAGFSGDLAPLSDLPPALAPGEAIYVHASEPVELSTPEPARRIAYYHPDHLGSASAVTDAAGALVEETAYYPFGVSRNEHRPRSIESNYGFTQKERDPESRLHYFEARYLAGSLARFVSADPKFINVDSLASDERTAFLQQPQKLNPFAYVLNRPLNQIDRLGLDESKAGAQRNQKTERPPPQNPKPGPVVGPSDPSQSSSPEYVLMLTDSSGETHRLAIDSFGAAGNTPLQGGVGSAAGKPRDFIATRRTDASSPDLQQAAAKGTSFKSATIIVRTRGPQSVERMRIELSEGYVLGYQFHGGGDPTRRWETVSLSANDIKIVLPEPPVHGPMPAPVPVPYPNTPPK